MNYLRDTLLAVRRRRTMTCLAADWVKLATQNRSYFVSSDGDDSGAPGSPPSLSRAGRADMARVMVLRSNANYTEQREGQTAAQSLEGPFVTRMDALRNSYRVSAVVIHAPVDGWAEHKMHVP